MEWAHSLQFDEPNCVYKTTQTGTRLSYKKHTGKDADHMERNKTSKHIDTAALLSDVKKIFACIADADEKCISYQQKISFFENANASLVAEKRDLEQKYIPQLPTPSDNYPRYPGRGEDALKWLEKHWGKYLKYFGAEKDYLYQDQLRKLDPHLTQTLTCQKYRYLLSRNRFKLRDIIPRKSDRLTEKLNTIIQKGMEKEIASEAALITQRRYRPLKGTLYQE